MASKFGDKVRVYAEEDHPRVGFVIDTYTDADGEKAAIQIGEQVHRGFAYRGEEDAKRDGSGRTYREID